MTSFSRRFCYGVGHVLNDLCASMWFSYLLLYFHKVLEFSNSTAGYVLLAGQIADGIATPLVGYESDRRGNICGYGRRKSWHISGTIAVAFSFPPLFMRCIGCSSTTPEYAEFIYYVPLVVIFQVGWAATQINHLALIPELARNSDEKLDLNAIRYAFTVLSNILVYVTTWLVFNLSGKGSDKLSPSDIPEFRNIVLAVVATGLLFSVVFHVGVKEHAVWQRIPVTNDWSGGNQVHVSRASSINDPLDEKPQLVAPDCAHRSSSSTYGTGSVKNEKTASILTASGPESAGDIDHPPSFAMMKWSDWFKKPAFYQMALLYMCTRLVVNLSQVYLPMYLTDTLLLEKSYIALVPLIVYVSGFVATIISKPASKVLDQEVLYIIGSIFVIGACVWSHFLKAETQEAKTSIFILAIFLGLGSTVILVMCLSMLSEMVGQNTETGAFVYGAMSLTDKISNGIAIAVIQNLNPCFCNCPLCGEFFEIIIGWLIPVIVIIGVVALAMNKICGKENLFADPGGSQRYTNNA